MEKEMGEELCPRGIKILEKFISYRIKNAFFKIPLICNSQMLPTKKNDSLTSFL